MPASRLLAGIVAGAIGGVAALAAAALAAFLLYGDWRIDPFPPGGRRTYQLPLAVGALAWVSVMAAVFSALERTGLVGGPTAQRDTLGLTARLSDPPPDDGPRDQV